MHLSRLPARAGLLAVAAALTAALVAAPGAGAATFDGGPFKLDFKTFAKSHKAKIATKGADPKTKTGGTFDLGTGSLTMVAQSSGNIGVGGTSDTLTITVGKKKAVLSKMTEKLTSGKGQLNAVVNGKGKAVTLFDQASQGKIRPSGDFTSLSMSSSNMQLTKSGAAALNKALGLEKSHDFKLKAKQKVGTASFTAQRSLTIGGGKSETFYNTQFYDTLKSCDITLSALAPATAIPQSEPSAPRGGASLPISGGKVNAVTKFGQVTHTGGTNLRRPGPGQPGNTTGKADYNSDLTDFAFDFSQTGQVLSSFVKNLNLRSPTGTVTGSITTTLNDAGGTVNLTGELVLSDAASALLSSKDPPLGADCPIPPGSKIGTVVMSADAN